MARVSNLSNTLNRNSSNILGLVQSSLDLPTNDVYDFALWFNTEYFETDKIRQGSQVVGISPALDIKHPIAFHDFSDNNQCMGYGLRAINKIGKNEHVLKMKTSLGLLSNSLVDSHSNEQYEELRE